MKVGRRYDFFLIWGHGLKDKFEMIKEIERDFKIIKIYSHKPKKISKFIKEVYSYDYAPFHHLKSKTKYLKKTKKEVLFIIVENIDPKEDWLGEGKFRHVECLRIKKTKERIRDIFNEKKNNRRSDNHVIHASDNQAQTNCILKYLGFEEGIRSILSSESSVINYPYHLGKIEKFSIKEIDLNDLYASILKDSGGRKDILKIHETPHFLGLKNDYKIYDEYLKRYLGTHLTDYYSLGKLKELSEKLKYLDEGYDTSYIITKKMSNGKYKILDGLHRASILAIRGTDKIIVAVVN